MRSLIEETVSLHSPETLVEELNGEPGTVLLRSALFDSPQARYSFVAARPFLAVRSVVSAWEWCGAATVGRRLRQWGSWTARLRRAGKAPGIREPGVPVAEVGTVEPFASAREAAPSPSARGEQSVAPSPFSGEIFSPGRSG